MNQTLSFCSRISDERHECKKILNELTFLEFKTRNINNKYQMMTCKCVAWCYSSRLHSNSVRTSPALWSLYWNDRPQGKRKNIFQLQFRLAQSLEISPSFSLIHSNLIISIRFLPYFRYNLINWKTVCRVWTRIFVCYEQQCIIIIWMNDRNEKRQLNISFERTLSLVSILFVHSMIFFPFIAVYIVNSEQYIILNAADESRTPMENVYISMEWIMVLNP